MLVLIEAWEYLSHCTLNFNPILSISLGSNSWKQELFSSPLYPHSLCSCWSSSQRDLLPPPWNSHCFSLPLPSSESAELSYTWICPFSKLVAFCIQMTPLAFLLTPIHSPYQPVNTKWAWGGGWVWKSSWLAWGLIQRNDGRRRPRKQLEYSAGCWSQMLSQGTKGESRCLKHGSRSVKNGGKHRLGQSLEAIKSIHSFPAI